MASALAAAKELGVQLGNPHIADARVKAEESRMAGADEFARSVAPVIRAIQAEGVTSLRGIARELIGRKVETRRGVHGPPYRSPIAARWDSKDQEQ